MEIGKTLVAMFLLRKERARSLSGIGEALLQCCQIIISCLLLSQGEALLDMPYIDDESTNLQCRQSSRSLADGDDDRLRKTYLTPSKAPLSVVPEIKIS